MRIYLRNIADGSGKGICDVKIYLYNEPKIPNSKYYYLKNLQE